MADIPSVFLSVAREFTTTPGFRFRHDGPFSGEQFLEELLLPRFVEARKNNVDLVVDLDDVEGYATSFLEASFGELARRYSPREVLETIRFKSDQEPFLVEEITLYVNEAKAGLVKA
jgi:hypothetical protein